MSDMAILFGRPSSEQSAEDRFEHEALAAEELEIESWAIPLEPVVNDEAERALMHLPARAGRRWLYRGWMLSYEEYVGLSDAMVDRFKTSTSTPRTKSTSSLESGTFTGCGFDPEQKKIVWL